MIYNKIFNYYSIARDGFQCNNIVSRNYATISNRVVTGNILNLVSARGIKAKYVFIGAKYQQLLHDLKQDGVVIIGGRSEFKYAIQNRLRYSSHFSSIRLLSSCKSENDSEKLDRAIGECVNKLKHWGSEYLILTNDSLPLERLWVEAARKVGVPSICIQHGLFSESGGSINDGKVADVICAYDEYQVEVLRKTGAANPRVFGYYKDQLNIKVSHVSSETVCIIGQPWLDYYSEKGPIYVDAIKDLINILNDNKIDWVYKPHPVEAKASSYIPDWESRAVMKPLNLVFDEYNSFISVSSTALLEATMAGKLSIQILVDELFNEDYSVMGYAHAVSRNNLRERIVNLLTQSSPLEIKFDNRPLLERFRDVEKYLESSNET